MQYIQEHEKAAAELRLAKFFMDYNLSAERTGLTNTPVEQPDIPEFTNGGVFKFVAPVAFGVAGFFLGGVPGAIAGLSLGMSLTAGVSDEGNKKKRKRQPTYTFSMAGTDEELAKQGDVIPIVYCNSVINPKGGVRWSGKMVAAKVINDGDSGFLYQVLALSLGRIGGIDVSATLINNQPTERFYPEDIQIEFLPGTPSFYSGGVQSGFSNPEFNFLGHVITPDSFNLVGVNLRALARSASATASGVSMGGWTTANCYQSSGIIVKNSGTAGVFDAAAYTEDTIGEGGGSFSFSMTNAAPRWAGFGNGLGNNMDYGIRTYFGGVMELNVFGTIYTQDLSSVPFTWSINDELKVDLTYDINDNKIVNFIQNSVTIFTVQNNWSTAERAKVVLSELTLPFQIESVNGFYFPSGQGGAAVTSTGGGEMVITVFEDEENSDENYEKFTPAEIYEAGGQEFRVLEKLPGAGDDGRNALRCTPAIPIGEEDSIFAVWTAYYQTYRRCHEVTFNLDSLFFSRPKPIDTGSGKGKGK